MMLNPKITLLRATASALGLARQAIVEVNLPTLDHRAPIDDAALAEFLADSSHYLLLAVENEKVAGSLHGYALRHPYRREPQFFLYGIDVRPACRNHGIGTALVERFILEAQNAGAFEVWVLTNRSNRAAMAMYGHSGLKEANADDVMLTLPVGSGGTSKLG